MVHFSSRWFRSQRYWYFLFLLIWLLRVSGSLPVLTRAATAPVDRSSTTSTQIAPGVEAMSERLATLSGSQQISLLKIDLTNRHVRLGVVAANDHLLGQGETVSSMAARTHAIAGINGDYFEYGGLGAPLGMVEINGQLWQSPFTYDVFGVTASGRVVLGHESFAGSVNLNGESYPLNALNRHSGLGGDSLTLFTPLLGGAIPLPGSTVVWLQPAGNSSTGFTVQSLQDDQQSLATFTTGAALVASGKASQWLQDHLQVGSQIDINMGVIPDSDLVQAIGGGDWLIRNGVYYHDPATLVAKPTTHTALTALGLSRDKQSLLLVVCNGKGVDSLSSPGFNGEEMAGYLLTHGAYQALLFDGGGSSTMVARLPGQVTAGLLSVPTDHHERRVANGLFVYSV